jgi:alkylation response protein AidB-like acyl-CoA dehydrogenase
MDLEFDAKDLAFQQEARAFIAENYPKELRAKQDSGQELGKEDFLSWHRILYKQGWIAPSWPVEYGGTGWTTTQKFIWSEEIARADCVRIMPFGVTMVGPVIYTFGTEEQKQRFLPRILSGEDWWCQGYSEPGSGSDLASLSTRAVRDGDDYVVNGQKTWTTMAQHADWGFFLVRTNPEAKQQEGISFLLIDMKTPGITVRPIITLGGEHEVNEVWLEDVRVPVANRIYEEDKGWTCAKFLLAHERTGIAGVAGSKRGIERIKQFAKVEVPGGEPLIADRNFRRKVSELEMDLTALEFTELRTLAGEAAGKGPGPEASMLKVIGSEIQQRITELTLEAAGHYGAPWFGGSRGISNETGVGPDWALRSAQNYFNVRKTTIYGGSNEIQRNIISKAVLGL